MKTLGILALVIITFTEIAFFWIGKAPVTPFQLLMPIVFVLSYLLNNKTKQSIKFPNFFYLLFLLVASLSIYNHNVIRETSLLYIIIYFIEFITLYRLMLNLDAKYIKKAFKIIIYLYFINVLLCTVLFKLGLYNESMSFIIRSAEFGARPMGFASEPSYSAFIVSVSYISYLLLSDNKMEKNITLIYILSVILMTSSYGYLFLFLIFYYLFSVSYGFLKIEPVLRKVLNLTTLIVAILLISFLLNSDVKEFNRINVSLQSLIYSKNISSAIENLNDADASAFGRIGPLWYYFELINLQDIKFWLGHGIGTAGFFFRDLMLGIMVDDKTTTMDVGIIPAFLYDFGLLGMVIILLFIFSNIRNLPFVVKIMIILFLFNAGISTQIFWYYILSFFLVNKKLASVQAAT